MMEREGKSIKDVHFVVRIREWAEEEKKGAGNKK